MGIWADFRGIPLYMLRPRRDSNPQPTDSKSFTIILIPFDFLLIPHILGRIRFTGQIWRVYMVHMTRINRCNYYGCTRLHQKII
jgi:hypothetical protein